MKGINRLMKLLRFLTIYNVKIYLKKDTVPPDNKLLQAKNNIKIYTYSYIKNSVLVPVIRQTVK